MTNTALNGLVPVVGIIIYNLSKSKYSFRIASDINFDIALQRCITEIFQGIDFNRKFKLMMNPIQGDYSQFWNLANEEKEYLRCIRNGSGLLPRAFLFEDSTTNCVKPFINYEVNNLEAANKLYNIAKSINKKVLIRDYSFLGFPTLHVYIPGISEVMPIGNGNVIESLELISTAKKIYRNCIDGNKKYLEKFVETLEELIERNVFAIDYKIGTLLGINHNDLNNILNYNIVKFTSIIHLNLGRYSDAIKRINQFHKMSKLDPLNAYYEKTIYESIANGISKKQLISYFDSTVKVEKKQTVIEKINKLYDYSVSVKYSPPFKPLI